MSIERKIDDELKRLKVLPEQKSLQKTSKNVIINPSQLVRNYNDIGETHCSEVERIGMKIEREIKKIATSKNSVHGAYLGVKDFFAEKVYGRITKIDDLFGEMLYVLNVMGNDFEYFIKKGERDIEKLNQKYHYLREKGIKDNKDLEGAKERLEDMIILEDMAIGTQEKTRTYEEMEDYLSKRRELKRAIYHETFRIDLLEKTMDIGNELKYSVDKLEMFIGTVVHASNAVLNSSRAYSDVVRSTLIPYLDVIRTSKRYEEMGRIEDRIGKLSSKVSEMFIAGSREIGAALKRVDNHDSNAHRHIAAVNAVLPEKGYLEP